MRVLKFGGSSLATPERIARVAEIVRAARGSGELVVVVSALGGVTDALGSVAEEAASGAEFDSDVEALERLHFDTAAAVASGGDQEALASVLRGELERLRELLRGVALVGEVSPRTRDRILARGELLASPLVAAALRRAGVDAEPVDARALIVTDGGHGCARPDFDATRARFAQGFDTSVLVPVVTGFIAATADGKTTTLGRGGSDFTASIVAVAAGAREVELWTDVDGVMSADPRIVDAARPIRRLRFDELAELSHFGAKVVYPPSVHPVRAAGLVLRIKSTFDPESPGTLVSDEPVDEPIDSPPVRGITSISTVAMLQLEGDGMVGVPGVAMRLFGALARREVSVIFITQGSSEHSICFAVAPEDMDAAREAVDAEFALDRRAGDIDELVVEENVAVVAVVGAAMCRRPGIAGRLFSTLGARGINVRAIAQGSSELNISLVVDGRDVQRAIRAIHETFFESPKSVARVFLAGVGGVGRALLRLLAERAAGHDRASRERIVLAGVANSRGALVDVDGIGPETALERLASVEVEEGGVDGAAELAHAALADPSGLSVFVDCTAADGMAEIHRQLLAGGVPVVTANKKPLAGNLEEFRALHELAAAGLYHEATVGAGLPVVGTLEALLASGDDVGRIEGVFSGTASFLSAELARGESFSRAVARAAELDYTEPDPREDLGGEDAARKLLILARLAGSALERADVDVEPWIPGEPWGSMPVDELLRRLSELDAGFEARQRSAAAAGRRLVYLASWTGSRARVALTEIGAEHPCFALAAGENLIAFHSRRYAKMPLIVRGPGAGPEVTAAGVLADIRRAMIEQGPR